MLGRRQELNLQFQQITDGLLMSVAFWLAHTVRFIGAGSVIFDKPIGPFSAFQWLLFVIMPFGPIILEMQGFYLHPLQKNLGRSLQQLARAAFWLGLLIAGCAYFLRLDVPSRAVMPIFAGIACVFLLLREQITIARLRNRSHQEVLRERVLLVGTPRDLSDLKRSLPQELGLEFEVVAEIDPDAQPVSNLVKGLARHECLARFVHEQSRRSFTTAGVHFGL
jgi:FlaA1/EpsC-like NDP-sugar epimerase